MAADDVTLARTALLEVTPASTVGAVIDTVDEGEGVVSVLFANRMPGYPGWRWTVSIAHVEGDEPTVLEVELMPGEGALVAPDWVPWSDRLADYRAAQEPEDGSEETSDEDEDEDDSEDDEDDEDIDDEDDDESDDDDDDESDDDDLDDDDLGDDAFDGVDVEQAVEADDTAESEDDLDDEPEDHEGA